MLVLDPTAVGFGGEAWSGVRSVAVDRAADGEQVAFGDDGPHVVFADAPRQRVTVRVVRRLDGGTLEGPRPGDEGELSFETAIGRTDGSRSRVSLVGVVTKVQHGVQRDGVEQSVTMVAVSTAGDADPVTIAPVV